MRSVVEALRGARREEPVWLLVLLGWLAARTWFEARASPDRAPRGAPYGAEKECERVDSTQFDSSTAPFDLSTAPPRELRRLPGV
jgi:hypothetical protein